MKALLLILLVSTQAFAIPEANYNETFRNEVIPHFHFFHGDSFRNKQGMNLRYYSLTHPEFKKTLIIMPGRTEPAVKYAEVAYDLKDLRMNVFILDIQGQGESDRLAKDPQKGYVRYFNDYIVDLKQFIHEVVIPQTRGTEYSILSHSMGAAISAKYISVYRNHQIKKLILNAPMFELNTTPYKEWIARLYSQALVLGGKGFDYAPGRGPYKPSEDTFEKNDVTHSKVRFELNKNIFLDRPELIVAGPTARWVRESLITTKSAKNWGKSIKIPMMVFQAELDQVVHMPRQAQFCDNAPQCEIHLFKGSFHEILMEKDLIRDGAIAKIKKFLSK